MMGSNIQANYIKWKMFFARITFGTPIWQSYKYKELQCQFKFHQNPFSRMLQSCQTTETSTDSSYLLRSKPIAATKRVVADRASSNSDIWRPSTRHLATRTRELWMSYRQRSSVAAAAAAACSHCQGYQSSNSSNDAASALIFRALLPTYSAVYFHRISWHFFNFN